MHPVSLKKWDPTWKAFRKIRFMEMPLLQEGLLLKIFPRAVESTAKAFEKIHLGVVVQRKIANAVLRNRIKRRLRAAVQKSAFALPTLYPKNDLNCMILVKKSSMAHGDFSVLVKALTQVLTHSMGTSPSPYPSKKP